MFSKKITRAEFLKTGFLGLLVFLAAPLSKMFISKRDNPHRDAKYYKNLAG